MIRSLLTSNLMNRAITLTVAAAPIAALLWAYLSPIWDKSAHREIPVEIQNDTKPEVAQMRLRKTGAAKFTEESGDGESAITRAASAGLKRQGETLTPEFCARSADNTMARRAARFEKLFQDWDVDPANAKEALSILRMREISILENRRDYFKDAYNYKVMKQKDARDLASDEVTIELMSFPLGRDRATELMRAVHLIYKEEMEEFDRYIKSQQP
jgi:hypothetical protein